MSNKLVIVICSILLLSFTAAAYCQSPFEKGMNEFKQENYEEALEYFLWARKLEPTSSSVAFYTGLTY